MFYSLIVPLYNRPNEIKELLESLSLQTYSNFEVIVVEDGSTISSKDIVDRYNENFALEYFSKENSGPGLTRNFGAEQAKGEYFIFFDSDCIIPSKYLEIVNENLKLNFLDAFGGPDKSHPSFTDVQKAINYSMTSLFTTGGIRGNKKHIGVFHPRSFNMGISRIAFESLNGFSSLRFGEDIDFSTRIIDKGYKTGLLHEAYVFHKRRTNFTRFFRQVFNSGIARINLFKRHPSSLQVVHFFPAMFTIGLFISIVLSIVLPIYGAILMACFLIYFLAIAIDAAIQNKSMRIGLLAIVAGSIQLIGYGSGFISAYFKRVVFRKEEFSAFTKNFYK